MTTESLSTPMPAPLIAPTPAAVDATPRTAAWVEMGFAVLFAASGIMVVAFLTVLTVLS